MIGQTVSRPKILIRDHDRDHGLALSARVKGLGVREIRTAPEHRPPEPP